MFQMTEYNEIFVEEKTAVKVILVNFFGLGRYSNFNGNSNLK